MEAKVRALSWTMLWAKPNNCACSKDPVFTGVWYGLTSNESLSDWRSGDEEVYL